MRKLLLFIGLFIGLLAVGTLGMQYLEQGKQPAGLEVKVAFLGDQGVTEDSKKVLELVEEENTELLVVLGDFDYLDNPELWDTQFNDILGPTFPIFSIIGNHDEKAWDGYQKKITERIAKIPDFSCIGNVGVKSVCTYKNLALVSVAPGIVTDAYSAFISQSLATTSSDFWDICLWHKNQRRMQVGDKQNETGWGVYETCKDGGAIIATAHEHSYQRTHLLSNFEKQIILSTSSTLAIKPGQTFAFVSGLGGHSVRDQKITGPWWASIYTGTQGAQPGALFCTFNVGNDTKKARCYFKDISGKIPDTFEIVRK